MKITNHHKGPIGLPDGTVLLPGEPTTVASWDKLKNNAVVKGWLDGKILSVGGSPAANSPPPAPSLLGSDLLPAHVLLVDDTGVSLGEIVQHAHAASGLSVEGWNELDGAMREAKLADAVEQLRSEAIAAAEAKKTGAGTGDTGGGTGTSGASGSSDAGDKDALIARAKALGIAAKATWGVPKLQEAIAAAEAKKGEG
ncbi:hypothetical protein [Stenotrophomonas bentonitica]|uniref:hypothetical protein n=1 Tax=Stenotrophomonas bentonitica TaxID=1450134 RepID=UPI00345E3AD2